MERQLGGSSTTRSVYARGALRDAASLFLRETDTELSFSVWLGTRGHSGSC
jgi:hypothetical protein